MNMPGLTAEASLSRAGVAYQMAGSPGADERESRVELQSCPVGVLAACTPFLQACAGWCWWSRPAGAGTCSGCYSTCLDAHFWWGPAGLCKSCVTPGGPGTNICA
jgi:hypothetical protein